MKGNHLRSICRNDATQVKIEFDEVIQKSEGDPKIFDFNKYFQKKIEIEHLQKVDKLIAHLKKEA